MKKKKLKSIWFEGIEYARVKPKDEYRFLEVGETIQEYDEFSYKGKWIATYNFHKLCKVSAKTFYRRKINGIPAFNCEERNDAMQLKVFVLENRFKKQLAGCDCPSCEIKLDALEECGCGRRKINHFTLGLICEDCEIKWKDPY